MHDLFPARIETDRLVLEPLTTETVDAFDFYEHVRVSAPHIEEVTEYLTWDPHETPAETREFVEHVTEERANGDGATYLVRSLEDDVGEKKDDLPDPGEGPGEFAGLAGIGVDWETRTATLGTWLRKRYWGRGYSGERAAALIEVAFERLDLEAVVVTVEAGNEKSRTAVSGYVEAHGGHREGLLRNYQTDQDGRSVDSHRFTITRAEFEASKSE